MLGFSYVYDERGLVTERAVVSEEVTTTTQYTHDDLGRLTESVTGEYVATYAWDAASNLIAETVFDDLDSNLAEDGWETTRSVNDVNQVTEVVKDFVHHPDALTETTSYEYDLRGNRVHEELTRTTGGTTHTLNEVEYSFDGQDQIVGLHDTGENQNNDKDDTVVAWQRDGLGRALNVTENGDTEARVFDGTAIVAKGDTRVTRAPTGEVLFEAFEKVEGKNKKATEITVTREVLSDRLGSTVTFADGGVIDADLTLFSDFGDVLTEPEWDTVTGFTGMPDTAGLTEFATRAYDPEGRVWVQEDTYPGHVSRASSMNRYAYVEGAPETYVDAWGMYRKAPAVAAQQLSAVEYAAFMVEFAKLSVVSGYVARWQAQRDAGPADTVIISVNGGAARVDADVCKQSRECRQRMAIYATWVSEQTDISQIPTPSYWGVALAVGGGAACTAATGNVAVGSLCFAAAGAAGGLVDYSNNVDPLSFSTKDALVTAGIGGALGAAAPGAGALIGKVNTAAATRLPVLGTCVAACGNIATNTARASASAPAVGAASTGKAVVKYDNIATNSARAGASKVDDAAGTASAPADRTFVTTPRGTTYDIPSGWVARPANNGKGIVYQRPGATGDRSSIRIMEPTDRYPDGYVRVINDNNQPVDPFGKPGPRSDTHIPESYTGPWPAWPTS